MLISGVRGRESCQYGQTLGRQRAAGHLAIEAGCGGGTSWSGIRPE